MFLRPRPYLSPVVIACAIGFACSSPAPSEQQPLPPPPPAQTLSNPPRGAFVVAPDLPPLPAFGVASAPASPETVRSVYEFAARRPDVLNYMPCFCGCEQAGHSHNDDCFVAGRAADGKVTAWDTHGLA